MDGCGRVCVGGGKRIGDGCEEERGVGVPGVMAFESKDGFEKVRKERVQFLGERGRS